MANSFPSKTPSPSLSGAAGWSVDCLQEWGPFLQLAIPSMLMNCLEWWLYEIAGFLAGIVGEVELGAQSVVYQLAAVAYMVPAFLLHFVCLFVLTWSHVTMQFDKHVCWVLFLFCLVFGGGAGNTFTSQPTVFALVSVSNGFRRGHQRSRWKRPGRRVHGAGQAVGQGRPPLCMYESIGCPGQVSSCPPASGCRSHSCSADSIHALFR